MARRLSDREILNQVGEDRKVLAALDSVILALMDNPDREDITGENLLDVIRYRIYAAHHEEIEEEAIEEAV